MNLLVESTQTPMTNMTSDVHLYLTCRVMGSMRMESADMRMSNRLHFVVQNHR